MKTICKYESDRDDLIEYITERKKYAGILRNFTDAEIKEWAKERTWDSLWSICGGLWKDELGRAGLLI